MKKHTAAICAAMAVAILCATLLSACGKYSAEDFSRYPDSDLLQNVAPTVDGNALIYDCGAIAFDTLILSEKTDNVAAFEVYVKSAEGNWRFAYRQDRIGAYRVCRMDGTIEASALKIVVTEKYDDGKKATIMRAAAYRFNGSGAGSDEFRFVDYLRIGGDVWDGRRDDIAGYLSQLTDVILFDTLHFDPDGKLICTEGWDTFDQKIGFLRSAAGDRGINISVCLWFKQQDNAATRKYIDRYYDDMMTQIAAFADKYDIYGVDYDWEYPENHAQWSAYDKLVEGTAEVMHARGGVVTVALAPWGCGFSQSVCKKIDYVHLMSYDLFDARGEHAGYYGTTVAAVTDMLNHGAFEPRQICLGLSFYGRTADRSGDAWPDYYWDSTANGASLGKWGNKIADYEYTDKSGARHTSDGYVNGYAMTRDKTAYAYLQGLGGVMGFRALCDSPYAYEFSLHRAVDETVRALTAK